MHIRKHRDSGCSALQGHTTPSPQVFSIASQTITSQPDCRTLQALLTLGHHNYIVPELRHNKHCSLSIQSLHYTHLSAMPLKDRTKCRLAA